MSKILLHLKLLFNVPIEIAQFLELLINSGWAKYVSFIESDEEKEGKE